jgi:hypothetical protein
MTVCLPVQRSNEPEREEFEKLPVSLVEMLHMADRTTESAISAAVMPMSSTAATCSPSASKRLKTLPLREMKRQPPCSM